MVELFDNDETGYLEWVQANPQGFIANVDRVGRVPQYPMVHAATHGSMSSPKIGNFTTGDYVKFCCTDLDALEQYSQTKVWPLADSLLSVHVVMRARPNNSFKPTPLRGAA